MGSWITIIIIIFESDFNLIHRNPKKGKYKPLKFNFKSPAAQTFGSLSKSGFGSWANKANKLKSTKNRNRKNAKLRKEFGEKYTGLFRF